MIAICSIPAPATLQIEFEPRLSDSKYEALSNVSYLSSGKTLVHCTDRFWELIREGRDAIREVPSERFDVDAFYDPDLGPGKMNTRWAGLLERIEQCFVDYNYRWRQWHWKWNGELLSRAERKFRSVERFNYSCRSHVHD